MPPTDTSAAQEAELRALAVRADAGETLEISETPGNQGADGAADTQDKGTNNTQEQTGAALASDQQTEGKQAQTQQAPNAPKDGQQQQPAVKKESEYQKFQREKEQLAKEKARLANTWQQVQAEKERLRQGQTQQRQAPAKPAAQQQAGPLAKIPTEELHDIAAEFEATGDTALAKKVRAEIVRRESAAREQPPVQQQSQQAPQMDQEQFVQEWTNHLRQCEQADPDLAKPDSPLRAEVREVIKGHSYFSERPDRIREAVNFAKLRLEAKAAPELRKRVSTLESELTTLRKATAPGGGSAESRGGQKSFEDMSESERIAYLKREAAAVDAA